MRTSGLKYGCRASEQGHRWRTLLTLPHDLVGSHVYDSSLRLVLVGLVQYELL